MSVAPQHSPRRPVRGRRALALSAAALVASLATGGLGLASSASAATSESVSDASFVWGLDNTASAGAYFGGCNFLSAGTAGNTGSSTPWTTTNPSPGYSTESGNVTVEKPDTAGNYTQPTWATKCQGPDGTPVNTSTNTGTRVHITGGTGTVDPTNNTASVQWKGSFTSAFYGGMVYWTATDPQLTVNADGTGKITATLTGYGADMSDPTKWAALPATQVTLADLTGVKVTDTGFTTDPNYRGVKTTSASGTQYTSGDNWGSWPQSFIDFQNLTGEASYWYSSNLADADKVARPVTVGWTDTSADPGTTPDPSGTTTPTTTPTTTVTSPTTSAATPSDTATAQPTTATSTGTASASASAGTCTIGDGVKGGSLVWGFKKSFRSYVLAGGSANDISAEDGTEILDQDLAVAGNAQSGAFQWPFESSSAYNGTDDFSVQYGGRVEFSYPAHLFDIVIADPEVVVKGASGTLYADVTLTVTGSGADAAPQERDHVALASMDLSDASPATGSTGVSLVAHTAIQDTEAFTFDGSAFYQKGQALDDATVLLSGCTGTQTGDTGSSGSGTSGSGDSGDALASGGDVPTLQYRDDSGVSGSLASTGAGIGLPLAGSVAALVAGGTLVLSVRSHVRRQRTS